MFRKMEKQLYLEEFMLFSQGSVFRQVPACLAHEPHRGGGRFLSPAGEEIGNGSALGPGCRLSILFNGRICGGVLHCNKSLLYMVVRAQAGAVGNLHLFDL